METAQEENTPVDFCEDQKKSFFQNLRSRINSKKLILPLCIFIVAIVVAIIYVVLIYNPGKVNNIIIKSAKQVSYFSVTSTTPSDQSIDNAPNASIMIIFSQPVNPSSLKGYLTVSPMIPGTFTQGKSDNEVVFTTKFPFGGDTSVKVILNKGFKSAYGSKFPNDYTFGFQTQTIDNTVVFVNGQIYSRLTNLTNGQSTSFTLQVGNGIDPKGTIDIYKGDLNSFLSSMIYKKQTNPGTSYITQTYLDYPVDTTNMQKVSEKSGLQDQGTLNFNEPSGLYYITAKSNGAVVGSTWVNVTDEGLIIREDDQNVYIAAQNIKTGQLESNVNVSLYNLLNSPTNIGNVTITNYGKIPLVYPQTADIVVGQTSDSLILAPLSAPETQADTRVTNNLSNEADIYLTTDKPTYQAKETVKFTGILRIDNDGKYTLPSSGGMVKIWAPDPDNQSNNIIEQDVTIDQRGTISGTFIVPSNLTSPSGTTSTSLTLFAKLESDNANYNFSKDFTTFDVLTQKNQGTIKVSFSNTSFTKDQNIVANITGIDSSGKPLSNAKVQYTIYSTDYYENDPSSVATFGQDWGNAIQNETDVNVTLDNNGQTSVKVTSPTTNVSQELTLEASTNIGSNTIYGAKTVLIHQGNIVLSFGQSRQIYQSGDTTISRVYATDLSGNPVTNQNINYEIYTTTYNNPTQSYIETPLYEGTVTTDSNGFALISQQVASTNTDINIRATTHDSIGNEIEVERTITLLQNNSTDGSLIYYHATELENLDISSDKQTYAVGDTANLTINSPFDQNIFVTYESGRIYYAQWLKLNKGDNTYSINITKDLSPSFNLIFSYFNENNLVVEGLPFTIKDPTRTIAATITTDKQSYTKNDSAQITVSTKDNNGQPLPSHILVDVLDNNLFNLRDIMPSGSIEWFFDKPRISTTNTSSSILGIGTGGGCGGGSGIDITNVPNGEGDNIYWALQDTDQNGQLNIQVPLSESGDFRILVTTFTDSTAVTQASGNIVVQ